MTLASQTPTSSGQQPATPALSLQDWLSDEATGPLGDSGLTQPATSQPTGVDASAFVSALPSKEDLKCIVQSHMKKFFDGVVTSGNPMDALNADALQRLVNEYKSKQPGDTHAHRSAHSKAQSGSTSTKEASERAALLPKLIKRALAAKKMAAYVPSMSVYEAATTTTHVSHGECART